MILNTLRRKELPQIEKYSINLLNIINANILMKENGHPEEKVCHRDRYNCYTELDIVTKCIYLFHYFLFYYSCLNFVLFALLCPAPYPAPTVHPTPLSTSVCHSYMFFDLSLPLFHSSHHPAHPSGRCQSLPCFHVSVLFCSLAK